MALSQYIKRGQAPVSCILCDKETKINWKCLNCNMLMCAICKDNIHIKYQSAKDHKIINIKEIGQYPEEMDLKHIKCKEHDWQSCVMFCLTCDISVCTTCISKIHNGHGLVEINEGYNIKMEKLKNEHKKAKEKIDELTKRKREMSHVDIASSRQYKDLIEKIEAQNAKIKNAADKYTEEIKRDVSKKWSDLQKEEFSKVDNVIDNLHTLSLNAGAVIHSHNFTQVLTEYETLSQAINLAETGLGTISFLPTEISPYIVGSVQVVPNDVRMRFMKQFKTDIACVFYLSASPDNSVFISDNNVLQRVKPEEHRLTVVSKYDIDVRGMAVTQNGDLLLSSCGSVLKQINRKTGEITESIYTVHPLYHNTVHSTKDGKVIVGAYSGKAWPANGRRVIIVMKQNGEHQTIFEYDKHSIPIFTRPTSITSTDNGNICVVDEFTEGGRVVVLSQHGDILHIYRGHPDIDSHGKPFKPLKIATTPSDNLIVTVLNSDTLHILNNCGQLMTHYNMRDIGIRYSFSVSFTRTGQLYIGCTGAVGESEQGQLYQVNICGC